MCGCGCGHLGKFHAQKYAKLDESELVAVSDQDEESGGTCAKEWKIPFFKDYRDLLGQVEAVTIATTTSSHYEVARFFLENRVHVHVEKPMTTTSVEGEKLCELAEKNNLKLQVGHVERFNSALVSAREKLKKPLFIECHRLSPFKPRGVDVSVVLDLMIHDLDVILSLVQSEVIHVSAVGTPVLTRTLDIANARVEFGSGAVANITASRVSQGSQRKFRVFQPNQYLSIDFGSGEVSLLTKTGEWTEKDTFLHRDVWNLEKTDALLEETRSFVTSIRNQTGCVVSGRDGLVALKLAERITEAIRKKL